VLEEINHLLENGLVTQEDVDKMMDGGGDVDVLPTATASGRRTSIQKQKHTAKRPGGKSSAFERPGKNSGSNTSSLRREKNVFDTANANAAQRETGQAEADTIARGAVNGHCADVIIKFFKDGLAIQRAKKVLSNLRRAKVEEETNSAGLQEVQAAEKCADRQTAAAKVIARLFHQTGKAPVAVSHDRRAFLSGGIGQKPDEGTALRDCLEATSAAIAVQKMWRGASRRKHGHRPQNKDIEHGEVGSIQKQAGGYQQDAAVAIQSRQRIELAKAKVNDLKAKDGTTTISQRGATVLEQHRQKKNEKNLELRKEQTGGLKADKGVEVDRENAALVIQNRQRAGLAKAKARKLKSKRGIEVDRDNAALAIQGRQRLRLAKAKAGKLKSKRGVEVDRDNAALVIQSQQRAKLAKAKSSKLKVKEAAGDAAVMVQNKGLMKIKETRDFRMKNRTGESDVAVSYCASAAASVQKVPSSCEDTLHHQLWKPEVQDLKAKAHFSTASQRAVHEMIEVVVPMKKPEFQPEGVLSNTSAGHKTNSTNGASQSQRSNSNFDGTNINRGCLEHSKEFIEFPPLFSSRERPILAPIQARLKSPTVELQPLRALGCTSLGSQDDASVGHQGHLSHDSFLPPIVLASSASSKEARGRGGGTSGQVPIRVRKSAPAGLYGEATREGTRKVKKWTQGAGTGRSREMSAGTGDLKGRLPRAPFTRRDKKWKKY
jgi:hypothetical protein